jgi:hypothetical protein
MLRGFFYQTLKIDEIFMRDVCKSLEGVVTVEILRSVAIMGSM